MDTQKEQSPSRGDDAKAEIEKLLDRAYHIAVMSDEMFGTTLVTQLAGMLAVLLLPTAATTIPKLDSDGLFVSPEIEAVRREAAQSGDPASIEWAKTLPSRWGLDDVILKTPNVDKAAALRVAASASEARYRIVYLGGSDAVMHMHGPIIDAIPDPTGRRKWLYGDRHFPDAGVLAGDLRSPDGSLLHRGVHLEDLGQWARNSLARYKLTWSPEMRDRR